MSQLHYINTFHRYEPSVVPSRMVSMHLQLSRSIVVEFYVGGRVYNSYRQLTRRVSRNVRQTPRTKHRLGRESSRQQLPTSLRSFAHCTKAVTEFQIVVLISDICRYFALHRNSCTTMKRHVRKSTLERDTPVSERFTV